MDIWTYRLSDSVTDRPVSREGLASGKMDLILYMICGKDAPPPHARQSILLSPLPLTILHAVRLTYRTNQPNTDSGKHFLASVVDLKMRSETKT